MMRYIAKDVQLSMYAEKEQLCPDVGAGNGNDHVTGDVNASGMAVVCQAYNDDSRPKWANLVNGVRPPTKTTRIKLNKTLDAKIKGLVLTDAQ
jgi:hypothetical protein